jgi:ABC-type nickel/cobalt efflux system permease component RcnA
VIRPAILGAAAALVLALAVPAVALGHPLGNFTINVYVGIRASMTGLHLDTVVDRAEIPTFQERLALDEDGDGELSDAEIEDARVPECTAVQPSLTVVADHQPVPLHLSAAGLSFPPGAGGLSTTRLVCEFDAVFAAPITGQTLIHVTNRIEEGRLGWREMTLQGDGVTTASTGEPIPDTSVSNRLTSYPQALLTQPFTRSDVEFTATPGGPALPPLAIGDAQPLPGEASPSPTANAASPPPTAPPIGAVPGGIGNEIPAVFQAADLSPSIVLLALVTAVVLGAGHALTPGHGKTLMAAYLVASRGSVAQAAGLGLAVTVSHTLGILALALLIVAAQSALPPDLVARWLPAVAALTFAAIGAWMVVREVRRLRHERAHRDAHEGADHDHGHIRVPAASTLTARDLFALGLAGGIVPSTSALLILLATIAAGRAAFGVLLVVAFGIGMAIVMSAVALAMVGARGRLDRIDRTSRFGRLAGLAPLLAGIVVFAVGIWLTGQAIIGLPTL